ncbi:MAG: hypothetical protein KA066_00715 [Candidatus Pacebacteria bacterium]|nr:hypothetical protein [Candidatus Paceibacterota bacterium]
MKPTIIFNRASPQYEAQLIKYGADYVMPSDEMYEKKIDALKASWSEWGPKVLDELHAITRLEWLDKDIRCYIVSGTKSSFSHPLTLKLYKDPEHMFDTFVHELIHRLLNNPLHPEEHKAARKKFMEPHQGESMVVKNHIILHALHAQVVLNLYGQERLDRVIAIVKSADYLRAWDIVHERGREQILKEVFNYQE